MPGGKKSKSLPKKRIVTNIFRWVLSTFFIVFIVAGISFTLVLGSERGRVWSLAKIVSIVNQRTSIVVQAEGVGSSSLRSVSVSSLRIKKNNQLLLNAQEVSFVWNPYSIVRRHIALTSLDISRLDIYNTQTKAELDSTSESTVLDINLIPEFMIDSLAVSAFYAHGFKSESLDALSLGLGIKAGVQKVEDGSINAQLSITSLHPQPSVLEASIFIESFSRVEVKGLLTEPAGGATAKFLRLPPQEKVNADFHVLVSSQEHRYLLELEKLTFNLAGERVEVKGGVELNSKNNDLLFNNFIVNVDGKGQKIHGRKEGDNYSFDIELNRFPISIVNSWDSTIVGGFITGKSRLTGTIENPNIKGSLYLSSSYEGEAFSVDFLGEANRQLLILEKCLLSVDDSKVSISGLLDLKGNSSRFSVSGKGLDLGKLQGYDVHLPEGLEAKVLDLNAQLYGPLKNPNGQLKFTVKGQYKQQSFTIKNQWSKKNRIININKSNLLVNDNILTASGWVNISKLVGSLSIDADSIPISFLELLGVSIPQEFEGRIGTQMEVSGDLLNPVVKGQIAVDGEFKGVPYQLGAKVSGSKQEAVVQRVDIASGGKKFLIADGKYENGKFELNLKSEHIPSFVYEALGVKPHSGSFKGDIGFKGTLDSPIISGNVSYNTTVKVVTTEQGSGIGALLWSIDLTTIDSLFTAAVTLESDTGPSQTLIIEIPLQPYVKHIKTKLKSEESKGFPIYTSIFGRFDLGILMPFLNQDLYRVSGKVDADVHVSGVLSQPKILGGFDLSGARFENALSGSVISNMDCRLQAEDIRFTLGECHALDGDQGKYLLSGSVILPVDKSLGSVDITLEALNANLIRRPNIESEASGSVSLTGDFKSLLASGRLEVAPLKLSFDTPLSNGIPAIKVEDLNEDVVAFKGKQDAQFALPKLDLDLVLSSSQQAYLRGRGLDVELQGKVEIRGDINNPRYDGEFKTVRGVLDVFNKRFKLTEGRVHFSNNIISITMTAVYEKNGLRIQADLTGTNENLKLHFSSTPHMPEDEILGYIILGKSLHSITPFEALQFAAAVQTLRGGGGFDPISTTRKLLGVDSLSVESVTTEGGESGVNVGVGKYLNEKVYLEFDHTPDPSRPWVGNIKIELSPNLNLESSTGGSKGIQGAELKWKKDY